MRRPYNSGFGQSLRNRYSSVVRTAPSIRIYPMQRATRSLRMARCALQFLWLMRGALPAIDFYVLSTFSAPLSAFLFHMCALRLPCFSWSFNYFFYNRRLRKVLFFNCMAVSGALETSGDSDALAVDDVYAPPTPSLYTHPSFVTPLCPHLLQHGLFAFTDSDGIDFVCTARANQVTHSPPPRPSYDDYVMSNFEPDPMTY
jgi:hypothetical protein